MLRTLTEHIEKVFSLESKLFLGSICSIRILNILEVITKIAKCPTLIRLRRRLTDWIRAKRATESGGTNPPLSITSLKFYQRFKPIFSI